MRDVIVTGQRSWKRWNLAKLMTKEQIGFSLMREILIELLMGWNSIEKEQKGF